MFEESMFQVEKAKVFVMKPGTEGRYLPDNLIEVPQARGMYRSDLDQVLSIMSKDYHPVSDTDVLTRFLENFQEANIEVLPIKHHITKSKDGIEGRTTFMEVELPQFDLFPATNEIQKCRVIIPNSYDGTEALSFRIMFWRLVCLNGMMSWSEDFNMKIKHRKGADARIQDAINLYIQGNLEGTSAMINQLGNTTGDRDNILNYLQNNRVLQGERWGERLMGKWLQNNTTTNLWELYNIFTDEITHSYGRNFGTKLNKMEVLNHEVTSTWNRVLNPSSQILIGGNA